LPKSSTDNHIIME